MSKKLIAILLALAAAGTMIAACSTTVNVKEDDKNDKDDKDNKYETSDGTTNVAVPETDAPGTDAPETDVPGTNAPETDAPKADVTIAQLHKAIIDAYGGRMEMDDMGNIITNGEYAPNTLTVNEKTWNALVAADPSYAEFYNDTFVESENPEDWVPVNLFKVAGTEEDSFMCIIDPALCEYYFSEAPTYMTQIDQLTIIKPAAGKTDAVVAALEEYNEFQQMMQYPMNVAKAQAAQIIQKGDYVFFIRLGVLPEYTEPEGLTGNETEAELEAIYAQMEAERLELAKAGNKKAINVINSLLG